MNEVKFDGRVIMDFELRHTRTGAAVGDIRMAVSFGKKAEDGRYQSFLINGTVWGDLAKEAHCYALNGAFVSLTGQLQEESWDDKTTGVKRSKFKVAVKDASYLAPTNWRTNPEPRAPWTADEVDNSNSFNQHSDFNPDTSGSMDDIPF